MSWVLHQNHIITIKLECCRCCCGCRWIWWWEEETGAEKWWEAALKWGAREAAAEAEAVAEADEGIILVAAGRYKWAAAEGGGRRTSVVVLEEDDVDEDPLAASDAEIGGVLMPWWCGDCCSMLHDRLHRSHKFIDAPPPPPPPTPTPTTPLNMLLLRRRFSLRSRTWCERCGAAMLGIVIIPCFNLWCWYRLADEVNVRVQPTKQHV